MNFKQISGFFINRSDICLPKVKMEIIVQKAVREDMSQVLGLIKELALFEKSPLEVNLTVAQLQEAGFNDPPQFVCFVAKKEATIIGMALVYFRFSTWKGRVLHLEDLIVTQSMRGKGVGMKLYTKVMQYAAALKVKRVSWEVLDWNEDAIQFYKKTGALVFEDWRIVQMNELQLHNFLK